jgi:hypothetical protein
MKNEVYVRIEIKEDGLKTKPCGVIIVQPPLVHPCAIFSFHTWQKM